LHAPAACPNSRARLAYAVKACTRRLSAEGNPEFATIMKVVQALGVKLSAEAV